MTADDPTADVTARLGRRLRDGGAVHAMFAAAVLSCRGRRVLDQHDFARLLGIPVEHVRSLETGRRPPDHAPRRLADLDPTIDWAAAGLTTRGHPGDPGSRHPAAGAPGPGRHGCPIRREDAPP